MSQRLLFKSQIFPVASYTGVHVSSQDGKFCFSIFVSIYLGTTLATVDILAKNLSLLDTWATPTTAANGGTIITLSDSTTVLWIMESFNLIEWRSERLSSI